MAIKPAKLAKLITARAAPVVAVAAAVEVEVVVGGGSREGPSGSSSRSSYL